MAKKVMVIGGTGNIGSAVTEALLMCGYEVSVFAKGEGQKTNMRDVKFLTGDRHDREAFIQTMREGTYDCAIDLAGFTAEDAQDDINAFPHVERLVFCSTGAIYGHLRASELPIRESYRAGNPSWAYGVNKRKAEDLLMQQYYSTGYPVVILRPSITYGRGNGITRQIGGDNSWLGRIQKGRAIVTGNPNIVRNFLHVNDAARAFIGALEHDVCMGQQYNLVGLKPRSWGDYHRAAMKALNREVEMVEIPLQALLAMQTPSFEVGETITESFQFNGHYSGEKIARDIPEFRETISLENGISMTIEMLNQKNLIPEILDHTYEDEMIQMQKNIGQL